MFSNQADVSSERIKLRFQWVESSAILIFFPITGYIIDSSDPFFVNYQFPWLVFALLLISLRYGSLFGIMSASVLIGMVTIDFYWRQVYSFPTEMIIGLLLVTMISAEFHDYWFRKKILLESKYKYIKFRMDEFTRNYHLLKASHNELEQHVANQEKSLRSSLLDLERRILSLEINGGGALDGISEDILKLFSDYTSIQIAAVYAVNEQKKIHAEPVACMGYPSPLWDSDPLIKEALRTGHVASIKIEDDGVLTAAGAFVVIPLVDVYQKIWGVIVINEMPLFSLHENTLDLFAVLGGRIGDLINRRAESYCYEHDSKKAFEWRLRRILKEIKHLNTPAIAIATIIHAEELQNKFLASIQTELREVDKLFIFKDNQDHQVFLMLLPYTHENGTNEFLNRIGLSKLSAERVYHGLDNKFFSCCDNTMSIYTWVLDDKISPEQILLEINQLCTKGFCELRASEDSNEVILSSS